MRALRCLVLLGATASGTVTQATAMSLLALVSATSPPVLVASTPLHSVETATDAIVPDVELDAAVFAIEVWQALESADPLPGASLVFGSASQAEEAASQPPACSDSFDNDGDGFTDFPHDPGCVTAGSVSERPRCQDGIDTDEDGSIDFDGGASVNGGARLAAPDPQCAGAPWRDRERP